MMEAKEQIRLRGILGRVFAEMKGGDWWTIQQLAAKVGCMETTASSQCDTDFVIVGAGRINQSERHGAKSQRTCTPCFAIAV